jgi:hypothetical protein
MLLQGVVQSLAETAFVQRTAIDRTPGGRGPAFAARSEGKGESADKNDNDHPDQIFKEFLEVLAYIFHDRHGKHLKKMKWLKQECEL